MIHVKCDVLFEQMRRVYDEFWQSSCWLGCFRMFFRGHHCLHRSCWVLHNHLLQHDEPFSTLLHDHLPNVWLVDFEWYWHILTHPHPEYELIRLGIDNRSWSIMEQSPQQPRRQLCLVIPTFGRNFVAWWHPIWGKTDISWDVANMIQNPKSICLQQGKSNDRHPFIINRQLWATCLRWCSIKQYPTQQHVSC